MSSFDPPLYNSDVFNPALFSYSSGSLSISDADKRYLKLSGGTIGGSLAITGSLTVSTLSLTNLTATNITGTIQTAAQPNITSLGTLSSLSVSGSISGTLSTASQPNITSVGTLTGLSTNGAFPAFQRTTMTNGQETYISIGKTWSNYNTGYLSYYHAGDGSTSNRLRIAILNAGPGITVDGNGYCGIGTETPSDRLQVNGTINATAYKQGGTTYNLASMLTAVPSTISITSCTASTISCTTLNQNNIAYDLSTFLTTSSGSFGPITGITTAGYAQASKAWISDSSNRLQITNGLPTVDYWAQLSGSNYLGFGGTIALSCNGVNTPLMIDATSANTGLVVHSLQIRTSEWYNVQNSFSIKLKPSTDSVYLGGSSYTSKLYLVAQCTQNNSGGNTVPPTLGQNSAGSNNTGGLAIIGNSTTPSQTEIRFNTETRYSSGIYSFNGPAVFKSTTSWYYPASPYEVNLMCWDSNFTIQSGFATANDLSSGALVGTMNNYSFGIMTNGTRAIHITNAQRVGIGTTSPRAPLEVFSRGTTSLGTGTQNIYAYDLSSGSYTYQGMAPVSGNNVACYFRGNIVLEAGIYGVVSDRRLKSDIVPLDLTLEHISKLNTYTYRYKGEHRSRVGLIAQELVDVAGQLVSVMDNPNLTIEQEGDLEGKQFSVDYNALSVMNLKAIQLLIERVKELEAKLSSL